MKNITQRIKGKINKVRRDTFGQFVPLAGQTIRAVEYALSHSNGGHYYEFGLYQGYTFYEAVKLSPQIHHFGFDSFAGMPENSEGGGFPAGRFAYSYERVAKNLLAHGAFTHKQHLIKGFFSESLTPDLQKELTFFKPGVVLIDSDLYSSAIEVLNFMHPLLTTGTIVIFDDWGIFDENAGEQAALRDYLKAHPTVTFDEITECNARKMFRVTLH